MHDERSPDYNERAAGRARPGTVGIRSFDQGLVDTLGAKLHGAAGRESYYVEIPGVEQTPGQPGVPVTYANPEDVMKKFKVPAIVLSRDDIAPSMNRWQSGQLQYRVPGVGATPFVFQGRTGYTSMEEAEQSTPFEIMYTINIMTILRNQANLMVDYVMKIFRPYCGMLVTDSEGDVRVYQAYVDGVGMMDQLSDVADRVSAFAVTLRVEAELDLADPETYRVVRGPATIRTKRR